MGCRNLPFRRGFRVSILIFGLIAFAVDALRRQPRPGIRVNCWDCH